MTKPRVKSCPCGTRITAKASRCKSCAQSLNAAGVYIYHERPAPPPEPVLPRVYRDPCQRCGSRGDNDCGHAPIQLGVRFG